MEFEAKKLLMERLDKSLLDHAAALSNDSAGPTILGVYNLQELAELHCYLKTAHEFNAAEVDGLLRFADPLEVAKACWEDNPHEYSFPICELLGTVRARERFPLAEPTPPPEKVSVRERLNAAIQEAHRQASGHSRDRGGEGR